MTRTELSEALHNTLGDYASDLVKAWSDGNAAEIKHTSQAITKLLRSIEDQVKEDLWRNLKAN